MLAVGRIISAHLVGKIILVILSFRIDTSKNKNNDYRVKETCTIMSTQFTYETDHLSLLRDLKMPSALIFFLLCTLVRMPLF